MNPSFRILVLNDSCMRCKLYTIIKDGSEFNEAVKFVNNPTNKKSEDFHRLKERLENIKNRHGARINFFKPEGTQNDLVHALHASAKKVGYLQLNHLRWYCIRLSERCIILGNGGVKHVSKTQNDEFLKEKEFDLRRVDRVIETAFREDELIQTYNGTLRGDLNFTKKRIEDYGI